MSPAYDLVNTRMHVDDSDFALDRGLFKDNFESKLMKINGRVGLEDFHEFARRLKITAKRKDKLLKPFLVNQLDVEALIQKSFLDDQIKLAYLQHYQTRLNQLNAY